MGGYEWRPHFQRVRPGERVAKETRKPVTWILDVHELQPPEMRSWEGGKQSLKVGSCSQEGGKRSLLSTLQTLNERAPANLQQGANSKGIKSTCLSAVRKGASGHYSQRAKHS